jgi:hypothetical protein
MNGEMDIHHGGCSAWVLPPDETCARTARSLVSGSLAILGLPDELVDDAMTVASELSTNAFLHGLGGKTTPYRATSPGTAGLPELWLYQRCRPTAQLVCKVFDPLRPRHPGGLRAGCAGQFAECGRGLTVVEGLSDDWGVELTRCRLGPWRVPGKTVWAALPLPSNWPRPPMPYLQREDAANELCAALARRGVPRIRHLHSVGVSLVSVRRGLTVWVRDAFSWQDPAGQYVNYPFTELVEVTEQVVRLHEELVARPDAHERSDIDESS